MSLETSGVMEVLPSSSENSKGPRCSLSVNMYDGCQKNDVTMKATKENL